MGVMLQAFYWNCPADEGREGKWWSYINFKLPEIAQAGFTSLWLPPANKAAEWNSMGYDPYDYYDLGEFNQKGGVQTWFGTKTDLLALIKSAHTMNLQVYADLVFNHNSGADGQEVNPLTNQMRWTKFTPASGKFPRDWTCFHPCAYESWDGTTFGDMPDLCHRNPAVYSALIAYARWLLEEIGFDGYRFDMVKGYGGWMVRSIMEMWMLRNNAGLKPYGVGECWDSERTIYEWLDETNIWSDNPVGAFDFPLRWRLQSLCDDYGFSLRNLPAPGVLLWDRPMQAVTFVENHDVARSSPIVNDKLLAYAFILTHEGYPCVFWQDYFNYNLGQPGNPSGIEALVHAHEHYAGGATQVLYVDDNLYVMQRSGAGQQSGLVFILNNNATWAGVAVKTQWNNTSFKPVAWRGNADTGIPQDKWTDGYGTTDFWAPPRGYAVYIPN
ncbi:MAG TPA: alpha-amylase domain-containing protein [Syntrophobacteria bacterium]|nr:alpha-amylase domain-containing protein [Syntrophobacteria bacterium]